MKFVALALASMLAGTVHAESIAVFAKNDFLALGSAAAAAAPAPTDPARAAFLKTFADSLAGGAALPAKLPVINPPEWGRTLSAATGGMIQYQRTFAGGFVCHLALHDLEPQHSYILTLNGNPEKQGNLLLPDPVPGFEAEKFYDFLFVQTDADGRYDATLGVMLTPGEYDVRLYVKDTTDFKIVLYRDFFRFTVR